MTRNTERECCSTQEHVFIEYLFTLGETEVPVGHAQIVRDCWVGIAIWLVLTFALGLFVSPFAAMAALGILAAIYLVVFGIEILMGHTLKCASLVAFAWLMRIPEYITP